MKIRLLLLISICIIGFMFAGCSKLTDQVLDHNALINNKTDDASEARSVLALSTVSISVDKSTGNKLRTNCTGSSNGLFDAYSTISFDIQSPESIVANGTIKLTVAKSVFNDSSISNLSVEAYLAEGSGLIGQKESQSIIPLEVSVTNGTQFKRLAQQPITLKEWSGPFSNPTTESVTLKLAGDFSYALKQCYKGAIILKLIAQKKPVTCEYIWNEETENAAFSTRRDHASVVFDNKLWIIGGESKIGGPLLNDVWYSSDGKNWIQATPSANWSPRRGHKCVVFDNKIWLLGGFEVGTKFDNDVWYSSDGKNWTQAVASAPWQARGFHAATVFNNALWIMGGTVNLPGLTVNDVWHSLDGRNWTQATPSANWQPRNYSQSVIFNNKMWILGGTFFRDAWYSTNGIIWNKATDTAPWQGISAITSVTFDNKIWVMGGVNQQGIPQNDVWYSTDGANWNQIANAPWQVRWGQAGSVFMDKIWITGGLGTTTTLADVWSMRKVCK